MHEYIETTLGSALNFKNTCNCIQHDLWWKQRYCPSKIERKKSQVETKTNKQNVPVDNPHSCNN